MKDIQIIEVKPEIIEQFKRMVKETNENKSSKVLVHDWTDDSFYYETIKG